MPVLHFEVHGNFLTEHFRDRVLEGVWNEAVTGLQQSLHGMTYDQAVRVLSGDAKLEGVNNDIKLLDDDAKDYKEDVHYQNDHILWFRGHYWTPYAYVSSYGRTDKIDDEITDRALHYADYKFQDICFECDIPQNIGPTSVLFKMTKMPPLWLPKQSDPQKSVDAYLEGCRTLDERGHSIRYQHIDTEPLPDLPDPPAHTSTLDYAARMDRHISKLKEIDRFKPEDHIDEILKQNAEHCDGAMHEFDFGGEVGKVQIPVGPLHYWALSRTHAYRIPYPWQPVCPRGLKLLGDDPYHTDWMVGAGIPLDSYHDQEDFKDKGFELMRELQKDLLGFNITVLAAGKPYAYGTIKHWRPGVTYTDEDIVVTPNASERYYETAQQAGAIICCEGGKMSHLAVVGLEENLLIVQDPSAKIKYPTGCLLEIKASTGQIKIDAFRALSMAEILEG